MTRPTLMDARELSAWRPPLGVISVYLRFDAADRGGSWRTELHNGVERILELAKDAAHERKVALRAAAARLQARFEDDELRPPPRGEVGFLAVAERAEGDRWWQTGVAPTLPTVVLAEQPAVTELVDLCDLVTGSGVALLSAERVRLLRFEDAELEELDEWELTILSGDWRERKARSSADPARGHGVSSSGHDQYGERLEHNRHRFLVESGQLAAERLRRLGLEEIFVFGPRPDAEAFQKGLGSNPPRVEPCGDADLISVPRGKLIDEVAATVARCRADRDRAVVERVLEEVLGGSRGAAGAQDVAEALDERRVDHLVLDPSIGAASEPLVRAALAGDATITIARAEVAEILQRAEGVAALLRY